MKLAVIAFSVALVAVIVVLVFVLRWEAWGGVGGVIFRLDRWSGEITACQVPLDVAIGAKRSERVACD